MLAAVAINLQGHLPSLWMALAWLVNEAELERLGKALWSIQR